MTRAAFTSFQVVIAQFLLPSHVLVAAFMDALLGRRVVRSLSRADFQSPACRGATQLLRSRHARPLLQSSVSLVLVSGQKLRLIHRVTLSNLSPAGLPIVPTRPLPCGDIRFVPVPLRSSCAWRSVRATRPARPLTAPHRVICSVCIRAFPLLSMIQQRCIAFRASPRRAAPGRTAGRCRSDC